MNRDEKDTFAKLYDDINKQLGGFEDRQSDRMTDVFIVVFLIACLALAIVVPLLSLFISDTDVWYDKKHGMKYTLTDSSFTSEWDFSSPLTMLKLTKLFIQGELDTEKRRKYIRQYNRLKESLKDKYDMSDFPDYKD